MATSIFLKFLTLKWNISRTIGRIKVGDGSSFCIFHALSFELNFFFDRRFPLNIISFEAQFCENQTKTMSTKNFKSSRKILGELSANSTVNLT